MEKDLTPEQLRVIAATRDPACWRRQPDPDGKIAVPKTGWKDQVAVTELFLSWVRKYDPGILDRTATADHPFFPLWRSRKSSFKAGVMHYAIRNAQDPAWLTRLAALGAHRDGDDAPKSAPPAVGLFSRPGPDLMPWFEHLNALGVDWNWPPSRHTRSAVSYAAQVSWPLAKRLIELGVHSADRSTVEIDLLRYRHARKISTAEMMDFTDRHWGPRSISDRRKFLLALIFRKAASDTPNLDAVRDADRLPWVLSQWGPHQPDFDPITDPADVLMEAHFKFTFKPDIASLVFRDIQALLDAGWSFPQKVWDVFEKMSIGLGGIGQTSSIRNTPEFRGYSARIRAMTDEALLAASTSQSNASKPPTPQSTPQRL